MMTRAMIPVKPQQDKSFLSSNLQGQIHAKRLSSLADSVIGVLNSQSLQASKMGDGLASAKGLLPKHARKQVDRLISNKGIDDELCRLIWRDC